MELLTIVHARKIEYIPIIYEFLNKAKKHILVFDDAGEENEFAEELKISIKNLYKKYGLQTEIKMIKVDEDSKKDMQQIVELFDQNKEKIYLNGAGSDTVLFTVLASSILKNNGKVIAYDKDDNNYNIITQSGFTNQKIEKNMNIEDFLLLMGEEILDEVDKEKVLERKEALNLIFLDTKRMFKVRYLLKKRKTRDLKENYKKILEALKELNIVDAHYKIKGDNSLSHFGILFEEFIYLQLNIFDFDDIKIGVRIRFDKTQVKRENIEVTNEFDILIIKENKIGFIECKIGDSHDSIATVYKSDSIMEYFGENASSLIINIERDKTPHFKTSKKSFSRSLLFRAKTKKVSVYNAFDFSKNCFRLKIKEAFGVEMKKESLKFENKKSMNELVSKWGGR